MRPTLIKTILSADIPGSPATVGVALGLINTLSVDLGKDLAAAQQALGHRRRQQHDKVLAETIIQAESLAYVARWLGSRIRPAKIGDELPVVITGLSEDHVLNAVEFDA